MVLVQTGSMFYDLHVGALAPVISADWPFGATWNGAETTQDRKGGEAGEKKGRK